MTTPANRLECRNCGGDGFLSVNPTATREPAICPGCGGLGHVAQPLTRGEARANARDPWICPRCHDTKSQGRDLCRGCESGANDL